MSSTVYAQNLATPAGASRLRTLGCGTGSWAGIAVDDARIAPANATFHAMTPNAMKRSTRHLGAPPT